MKIEMSYDFMGSHILSDFYEIGREIKAEALISIIRESCVRNSITILNTGIHEFENGGFTLFFLLAESHISVHFYIETQTAFIDIFTCGQVDPMPVFNDLIQYCMPAREKTQCIERGKHNAR